MSRGLHEVTEQPAGVIATPWGKGVSVPIYQACQSLPGTRVPEPVSGTSGIQ